MFILNLLQSICWHVAPKKTHRFIWK